MWFLRTRLEGCFCIEITKKKKTEIQTLGGELNENLQYINEYASFERIVVHGIRAKLVSN